MEVGLLTPGNMDRWMGKTAVVTGASSGIGAAVLQQLAKNGVNVVGLARRHQRVQEMAERLKGEKGKVHALRADITKEDEVVTAFEWIRKNLGGVDILINNAGVTFKTNITDGEVQHWRMMFELNVIALGTCTREALKSMKSRNVDDGHIINVCSVAGNRLPQRMGNFVYCSTKYAAKVITEGLRLELAQKKSHIKVTNLSPGVVDTEIFDVGGWTATLAGAFESAPKLKPEQVADAIVYALSTPPGVQISELTVRPCMEGW